MSILNLLSTSSCRRIWSSLRLCSYLTLKDNQPEQTHLKLNASSLTSFKLRVAFCEFKLDLPFGNWTRLLGIGFAFLLIGFAFLGIGFDFCELDSTFGNWIRLFANWIHLFANWIWLLEIGLNFGNWTQLLGIGLDFLGIGLNFGNWTRLLLIGLAFC